MLSFAFEERESSRQKCGKKEGEKSESLAVCGLSIGI